MSTEPTASDMASLVAQYHQSDQTRKAFAAAHGISLGKLIYWVKKMSKSPEPPTAEDNTTPVNFLPLKVHSSPGSNCVLIRLDNGVEIQIPM